LNKDAEQSTETDDESVKQNPADDTSQVGTGGTYLA